MRFSCTHDCRVGFRDHSATLTINPYERRTNVGERERTFNVVARFGPSIEFDLLFTAFGLLADALLIHASDQFYSGEVET